MANLWPFSRFLLPRYLETQAPVVLEQQRDGEAAPSCLHLHSQCPIALHLAGFAPGRP